MGLFNPCWGSLSRTDRPLWCDPLSFMSEQCGQCVKKKGETQSLVSTVCFLFTPLSLLLISSVVLWVESPSRLCSSLSLCPFLTLFSLFLRHLYFSFIPAAFTVSIHSHLPDSPYMLLLPPPPLYTQHPSPPVSLSPLKSEGKFIRSKNKHSSVLLHVTSPKAAPRYGWPCLFASSGGPHIHTHTHMQTHNKPQNAHTFQRTLKSSHHFYSPALLLSLSLP